MTLHFAGNLIADIGDSDDGTGCSIPVYAGHITRESLTKDIRRRLHDTEADHGE